jgi:hypothetical protein
VTSEDSTVTQIYTVTYDVAASIAKTVESNISILPTVSNGEFTLRTDGGVSSITIYTLSGKVAKQWTTSSSSTSFTLSKSQMYIVKVDNDNTSKMFKIVKR